MALQQPLFEENDTTDQHAIQFRTLLRDIYGNRPGVMAVNNMKVSQRGAGANMSVDVAVGSALITGSVVAQHGFYYVFNDAVSNVVISASNPSNPRITSVIIQVRDAFYSGANNDAIFVAVDGTPAASPSAPDLVALGYTNYIILANVTVPAAATSIVDANIANQPTFVSPIGTKTICTSSTRPSSPYTGQEIYETNTKNTLYWSGTEWLPPWNTAWGKIAEDQQNSDDTARATGVASDFVLSGVVVRSDRLYAVNVHTRIGLSALSAWHTDFVNTTDSDTILIAEPQVGGASELGVSATFEWKPTAGTKTLQVVGNRVSGSGTHQLLASAGTERNFTITDIGPR